MKTHILILACIKQFWRRFWPPFKRQWGIIGILCWFIHTCTHKGRQRWIAWDGFAQLAGPWLAKLLAVVMVNGVAAYLTDLSLTGVVVLSAVAVSTYAYPNDPNETSQNSES